MPTTTAKELRRQAKSLNIEGWEDMDKDELAAAIEAAGEGEDVEDTEEDEEEAPAPRRRATAKKAPAKKAVAKKAATTRPATKSAAKKAPAKKAAAAAKPTTKRARDEDEDTENDGPNPFREGSNLYLMTEELMKGGKRSSMVKRLERKIELKPRSRGGRNYDAAEEIDYRLVRVCQVLTNEHGFVIEKEGRGKDQQVKAVPPEDQ